MIDDSDNTTENSTKIDYIAKELDETLPLREPVIQAAIHSMQLPFGSRGLDAGCGIGHQTMLLTEAVGPTGHVTGLDLSPELLEKAKKLVEESGLASQIDFKEGNVVDLPFANDTFDWAWSMDCVGYLPFDQLPMLRELARVVKPGGKIAILAWSSEKLLSGYPSLEARLNATTSGIAPFTSGMNPPSHFLRALGWFREAGLEELTARTFAGEAFAPLSDDLQRALESLLEMRWPGVKEELTPEDWEAYQRLCRTDSEDFILNQSDYYAFFTYSMFCGLVQGYIY